MNNLPIAKPYFDGTEKKAICEVLASGWVTQGVKVARFEEIVAHYVGAKFAVATSSCTSALHLSLLALGIGKGDEVILPSFTFVATANAVEYVGAKPIFCDIDLKSFNIDPIQIMRKVTKKTKAMLLVHLFGLSADMFPILKIAKQHKFHIIEDCACSLGETYRGKHTGIFGKAGCFSFHPRKVITTGEGGMIVTNDSKIAQIAKILRSHGETTSDLARYKHHGWLPSSFDVLGYNYRMTDIQGAIGISQMQILDKMITIRKQKAEKYTTLLNELNWIETPYVPNGFRHVYQSYVCLINKNSFFGSVAKAHSFRNNLMAALDDAGIATRQGTYAVHTLGFYKNKYGYKNADFPNSFEADQLSIALPLFAGMSSAEQTYAVENIISLGNNLLSR